MAIELRQITLLDRDWISRLVQSVSGTTLEYNFTTAFIWRDIYQFRVAEHDEFLLLASGREKPAFLYPCGTGDKKAVLDLVLGYFAQIGQPAVFYSVSAAGKAELEQLYPGCFSFTHNRDSADYIYEAESLRTLAGKKLSAKRNHINRFVEAYPDWSYERITAGNIDAVYAMNQRWCSMADCKKDPGLREESCAVEQAFRHFFDLGLDGGLLRAGGEVVAYSMGDRLNCDTYLVHIEKAFADIQGAYPMINKQFVLHNCEGYCYIDREDDAGDAGLRKAKLSYRPAHIAEKYTARQVSRIRC